MVSISEKKSNELSYIEIVTYIVTASLIALLWQRAFENYFYTSLGLSVTATYVSYVLAFALTAGVVLIAFDYPLLIKGIQAK